MSERKGEPRTSISITPERVLKKINEARFFLKKMVDSSEHTELKSVEYLAPPANRERCEQFKKEIGRLRNNHPSLDYLLDARDVEVHRQGAGIVLEFGAARKLTTPGFIFPSAKFKTRFEKSPAASVYKPVYPGAQDRRDHFAFLVDEVHMEGRAV